jgi:hypothetical protein
VEADVKTFVGFVAPLAIAYMTWSSVTSDVGTATPPQLKAINVGQLASAPKLPSTDQELRDPFTPEGAVSAALAATAAGKKAGDAEKDQPLHLDGTVIAGKLRFAVINGTRVIEGDFFRGLKLERVEPSRVVLTGGKHETILPLEIAKSDEIELPPISAPAAATTREPAAVAAATGGMGGVSAGMGKSLPVKKASSGGMGAKTAAKSGGGGMGH